MKIAILQPGYLPWLGFFDQMQQVDTFVLYDDVQYDKNGWRNRNRIKTSQGVQWLTVPVLTSGRKKPLIKDVLIDNHTDWRGRHLKSIKQNYSRAPFFGDYIEILEKVYSQWWKYLLDVDVAFVLALRMILTVKTEIKYSSDMDVVTDNREQRLIEICRKLGADELLEGSVGRDYLEEANTELFNRNGIRITYQDYQHPVYSQLYGDFQSHLSVVDLLMNEGPEGLKILSSKSTDGVI